MNKKLIIACCIITILYVGCSLIPHHTEFDDKTVLEDAMEMSLPNYKITKFEDDPIIDCHGDFFNKIHIEFDNIPSQAFIDSVKQKVKADESKMDKRWLKFDEHHYCFQALYGDGGRTPKCREGLHDWIINLEFSDNSKEAVIGYGYW
jgi:hypothetical protein